MLRRGLLLLCLISVTAVRAASQSWTALSATGGPTTSSGSSAVYDHTSKRLILFGGVAGTPCCTSFNDVWILTNANGLAGPPVWTKLNPAAPAGLPPARSFQSAVYDSENNVMTIFGGGVAGSCGFFCTIFNDVWVLTNANGLGGTPTWTQLSPSGTAPAPREGHTAIYDSASNRMIVFGGGNNGIMNVPDDLWALTNANGSGGQPAWIQLSETGQTPPAVERFATAYDATNNEMTIFGGCCFWNNSTWLLKNANGLSGTPTWVQMSPTGTLPAIREVHAYGYDPASNSLIVFGFGGNGISYNDTWTLSFANDIGGTPAWTNIIPNGEPGSPPLPFVGGDPGVYDPVTRRLMLEKSQDNGQGQASVVPWVLEMKNQFITFDPPGSLGTLPIGINPRGEITGSYFNGGPPQGFLRAVNGTIITINPPCGCVPPYTFAQAINPSGEIVGYSKGEGQSFLRAVDGTFTLFVVPGSVAGYTQQSINPKGEITGSYNDASGNTHGFLRAVDGSFATFDAPGPNGTYPQSINPRGEITGVYYDASNAQHGFVRDKDGTVTTFNPPGSTSTSPQSISPKGKITGSYNDANGIAHGFVRDKDGAFATFDPPGSTGTFPQSINPRDEITGYYSDAGGRVHGFVCDKNGTFTTFDPPGVGPIGTYPASINPRGEITGYYYDANNLQHGFLRKPDRRAGSDYEPDDDGGEGSESPE